MVTLKGIIIFKNRVELWMAEKILLALLQIHASFKGKLVESMKNG